MGHYDRDYEHDERLKGLRESKENKLLLAKIEKLTSSAGYERIPKRFKEALEDLENWLIVRTE